MKYVIRDKRSRIFRNQLDAAMVKRQLSPKDVELVSAKVNFGDG